jgi:hypothetical protein
MRSVLVAAGSLAALIYGCAPQMGDGRPADGGAVDGPFVPPGGDGCPLSAKLVYVIDQSGALSSFQPSTLTFQPLGLLKCTAQTGAKPFSMSIDRSAGAWVLYNSAELFKVSTVDAACQKTAFSSGLNGFENYGMGFVSNLAGSQDETLYIAGGPIGAPPSAAKLGSLDLTTFTVTTHGSVAGLPELTGTGDAKLWGFYPSSSMPRVVQLDRASGAELRSLPLMPLAGGAVAWAFAFWGGDFWIFLQRGTEPSTNVWRVRGADGSVTKVLDNTGRVLVGAGVSTCAPTTIL